MPILGPISVRADGRWWLRLRRCDLGLFARTLPCERRLPLLFKGRKRLWGGSFQLGLHVALDASNRFLPQVPRICERCLLLGVKVSAAAAARLICNLYEEAALAFALVLCHPAIA